MTEIGEMEFSSGQEIEFKVEGRWVSGRVTTGLKDDWYEIQVTLKNGPNFKCRAAARSMRQKSD